MDINCSSQNKKNSTSIQFTAQKLVVNKVENKKLLINEASSVKITKARQLDLAKGNNLPNQE